MTSATDTISAATQPSARLARALDSERDVLMRSLRRLEDDRLKLRERLAGIEAEIQAADERLVLLAQLRGSADDGTSRPRLPASEHRQLTGPAIRMAAVALIRDLPQGEQALHYRHWLKLVEEAGYEVGGQKPSATFLSQINRSPVIRRTTRAGHYEIDRGAPARLRRHLSTLREQVANGSIEHVDLVDLDQVRQRRGDLVREIQKAERDLAEATATLTLPLGKLARSA
jgi:hypothetical protein